MTPPRSDGERPRLTPLRVVTWVVVGGVGVFLILNGIVGIIAKG